MHEHPFTASVWNQGITLALGTFAVVIQCFLLTYYACWTLQVAFVDSLLSVLLLGVAAYVYGFVANYLGTFLLSAALAVCVQVMAISLTFISVYEIGLEEWDTFAPTIPLRFLIGLLAWIILAQWYERTSLKDQWIEENSPVPEPIPSSLSSPQTDTQLPPFPDLYPSYPERLSVKDGSRLHIIPLEEILYLQASGDYVTVVTPTGQYIKEQTMKSFETSLPPTRFVRIHRSYIINTQHLVRVELFGKENYQVRLKNGVHLRASLPGYKLLKERLSL